MKQYAWQRHNPAPEKNGYGIKLEVVPDEARQVVQDAITSIKNKYPKALITTSDEVIELIKQGWSLSISESLGLYREDWTMWHVIREFAQNALDINEDIYGSVFYESFVKPDGVYIIDKGTGVQERHLSFHAFKSEEKKYKLRGRFGEGFKIAALVSMRYGYPVFMDSVNIRYQSIWYIQAFWSYARDGWDTYYMAAFVHRPGTRKKGTEVIIKGYDNDYRDRILVNNRQYVIFSCKIDEQKENVEYVGEQTINEIAQPFPIQLTEREINFYSSSLKSTTWKAYLRDYPNVSNLPTIFCKDIFVVPSDTMFTYNLPLRIGLDITTDRAVVNIASLNKLFLERLWLRVIIDYAINKTEKAGELVKALFKYYFDRAARYSEATEAEKEELAHTTEEWYLDWNDMVLYLKSGDVYLNEKQEFDLLSEPMQGQLRKKAEDREGELGISAAYRYAHELLKEAVLAAAKQIVEELLSVPLATVALVEKHEIYNEVRWATSYKVIDSGHLPYNFSRLLRSLGAKGESELMSLFLTRSAKLLTQEETTPLDTILWQAAQDIANSIPTSRYKNKKHPRVLLATSVRDAAGNTANGSYDSNQHRIHMVALRKRDGFYISTHDVRENITRWYDYALEDLKKKLNEFYSTFCHEMVHALFQCSEDSIKYYTGKAVAYITEAVVRMRKASRAVRIFTAMADKATQDDIEIMRFCIVELFIEKLLKDVQEKAKRTDEWRIPQEQATEFNRVIQEFIGIDITPSEFERFYKAAENVFTYYAQQKWGY